MLYNFASGAYLHVGALETINSNWDKTDIRQLSLILLKT
jgi:hypothetical protein